MQLLVQVLADESTGADTVDVDTLRHCEGINRCLQDLHVQCRRGVGDSTRSRIRDLGNNVGQSVGRSNVASHGCPSTMISFLELWGARQCDAQLGIPGKAESPTKLKHCGLRSLALPSDCGDRALGDASRVSQHSLRPPAAQLVEG
jgi:hypothetical protein